MSRAQVLFEHPTVQNQERWPHGTELRLGVFDDNRQKAIHRWYPFVEGYSADLVRHALDQLPPGGALLDPFGGSGTTALAAAELGYDCLFCLEEFVKSK